MFSFPRFLHNLETAIQPPFVTCVRSVASQDLEVIRNEDFFTRFTYHPARMTFEPDKVPVFCTCESPYNPDYFMIMCDLW